MPIAPYTYYAANARGSVSDTDWADTRAANTVYRLHLENRRLCGIRKLWHTRNTLGTMSAPNQVGRLMRICGISGAVRGKRRTLATVADPAAARHRDLTERQWGLPTRPDHWVVCG